MVGISYPGISQLYVARTQPPHLAAISPLSVLDDSYRATLWPGGILNTGFAVPWASQRFDDTPSRTARAGSRADGGRRLQRECDDNQLVRDQNPDPVALISDNHFYNKAYYQQIDPSRFAGKINVPVYLAGAWQDEQTGGHFPDFLDKFTSSPAFYATMSNGGHVESLANLTSFNRYADFLDLYVAHRVPTATSRRFVGPTAGRGPSPASPACKCVPGIDYTGHDVPAGAEDVQRRRPHPGHVRERGREGRARGRAGCPLREDVLVVADPGSAR